MGLDAELSIQLNEIKKGVMRRFKHQRFVDLNEELKKIDKKDDKRFVLNGRIRALKYDPSLDGHNIISFEDIELKVKDLIKKLEEREHNLIEEDGEASMLCELNIVNLITFLKHFEVKLNFQQIYSQHDSIQNNDIHERCFHLENTLALKVYF